VLADLVSAQANVRSTLRCRALLGTGRSQNRLREKLGVAGRAAQFHSL
jgi:hypothetical protein